MASSHKIIFPGKAARVVTSPLMHWQGITTPWMTNSSRYFPQHILLHKNRVTFRGLVWSLEAFLVFTINLHHWVGNYKLQNWPHGKTNIIFAKCSFQLCTRLMTLIFQLLEIFQKTVPNQSTQVSNSNWDSACQEAMHSSVSWVICVEAVYLK